MKYNEVLNVVKEDIERVLDNLTLDINIQDPLKSKLLQLLNAPSKHIRPLVSFLYLKAIGSNIDENQILYQSAIELVHNASLIHDDVIDESKIRRNLQTLNNEFGNKLAVICGDYLLSQALNRVIKIGRTELIQMFSNTLEVMSQGEINQQFCKFKIPTLENYIEKSRKKTAKLFETSLCGSLLIANSNKNGSEFANNFGIAFQIRDDLINFKTTKSDMNDGIYTAPIILSKGVRVKDDAIEKTRDLLDNYIDNAKNEIAFMENNKYKHALVELLELLRDEQI